MLRCSITRAVLTPFGTTSQFICSRLRKLTPIDFLFGVEADYQSYPLPSRHAFRPLFFSLVFLSLLRR